MFKKMYIKFEGLLGIVGSNEQENVAMNHFNDNIVRKRE